MIGAGLRARRDPLTDVEMPRQRRITTLRMIGSMARVLISLRIPSLTIREAGDAPAKRIDNSGVRFMKVVEVAAIPKVGDVLTMSAAAIAEPFQCLTKRSEWDDREDLFLVSCSYAKASIREADYHALVGSPDWTVKPLI